MPTSLMLMVVVIMMMLVLLLMVVVVVVVVTVVVMMMMIVRVLCSTALRVSPVCLYERSHLLSVNTCFSPPFTVRFNKLPLVPPFLSN